MLKTAVDRPIKSGLHYIASCQLSDGSFKSFSSLSANPFREDIIQHTTFASVLILGALAGAGVPESRNVCQRLTDFLLDQVEPGWSFNYWAKRSPQRRLQPYPDDLDDTFCAVAGLYLHDPSLIEATVLAKLTKILLAAEMSVGGPYRTWLVAADSRQIWLDVDIAVNSNVAYCLTLLGSPLPKLSRFIDDAIDADSLGSPYYPSAHMTAYYMARGYNGQRKTALIKIIQKLLASSDTDLERALCVSSLLRLDPVNRVDNSINKLVKTQDLYGAWPAASFCLDPAIKGKPYYNGAPALTTAFVLEALQLYRTASRTPASQKTRRRGSVENQDSLAEILKLAKSQCQNLAPDLRTAVLRSLNSLAASSNGPEITGLARRFSQSLVKPPSQLAGSFITALSLSNLCGWLAYTIYDDFLDEEGKPPGLISVANVAMRRSLDGFAGALPRQPNFSQFVRDTFDSIDSANAWELAHCRFERHGTRLMIGKIPNYGNLSKLAERSLGHCLPPMAILALAGIGADKTSSKQLILALRHYLIARQLNDDAHDCMEDLQNGHITPVVATLLSELKVQPGNHNLPKLLAAARRKFWHSTLLETCRLMQRQVRLSRQALRRSGLLKPDNVISELLGGLEISIADTIRQQGQAEDFIKHYNHKSKKTVRA